MSIDAEAPPHTCTLESVLGRTVSCPRDVCPLWEAGASTGCVLGRAALRLERADVAQELLALRDMLRALAPTPQDPAHRVALGPRTTT